MRSGFSLVELLLTIAIIGILSTVLVFNGLNYRNRQLLNTAIQQVVASIRDAENRSKTQQDGLPWGIYFNNTTTDSYTVFSGATYASSSAYTRIVISLDLPLAFTVPESENAIEVNFAPLTGNPNATTSVIITNGFTSNTITIFSNGQVLY